MVDKSLFEMLGPWPDWLQGFRPWQTEVIRDIIDLFESGKTTVFLSAPTGAGKTVIAEGVRKGLQAKGLFVCSTKSLQDQFLADFPEAKLLQGRGNYPTILSPDLTKLDCDLENKECSYCPSESDCPYIVARDAAEQAEIAVLNTAYYLHTTVYTGRFTDRELVVFDEGDLLPDILCDFAGVTISAKTQREAKILPPSNVTNVVSFNDQLSDWARRSAKKIGRLRLNKKDKKEIDVLLGLEAKLNTIATNADNATYIMERDKGVKSGANPRTAMVIRAVESRPVAAALTANVDRMLIMSATLLSSSDLAYQLGLLGGSWGTVEVPSPFEVARRLVCMPAKLPALTAETLGDGMPCETLRALEVIGETYQSERILIHTPSYALASTIAKMAEFVDRPVISYGAAAERNTALAGWLASSNGILISPSFARGLDLKYDLCRVQIITKIPYGSLGNPQIAARLYSTANGHRNYALAALREVIQASGRVCRSADDYGITFVLDGKFKALKDEVGFWFPEWFRESVVVLQTDSRIRPSRREATHLDAYAELSGGRHLTKIFHNSVDKRRTDCILRT